MPSKSGTVILNAYKTAQVHGQPEFNKTPLAPPGTRVLVHAKPR